MAPDVASNVNAVYEFIIDKDGKVVKTWGKCLNLFHCFIKFNHMISLTVLDLKPPNVGLYPGNYKNGTPNCIIQISDENMAALAMGDLDPVRGFMEGQIKIVGDPQITQKLNYIFKLDSSIIHDQDKVRKLMCFSINLY